MKTASKIISTTLLLSLIISTGCSAGFSLKKDEISENGKYGRKWMIADVMSEYHMNTYKANARRSIVEDESLSDDQKKIRLASLEKLKFIENRFLYFLMSSKSPFLKDELRLKFKILDSDNQDYFAATSMIPIKRTTISSYGSNSSYIYRYVLFTSQDLDNSTVKDPLSLIVIFPNKERRIYKISL